MNDSKMQTENRRILLIDDNVQIHSDYRKILRGVSDRVQSLNRSRAAVFGDNPALVADRVAFEVDSAYQGQEGLELVCRAAAEDQPYAVVFVDIRMPPGWDGITTVKRIWEKHPELEVVLCTAYSDYSWDEITEQLGRTDRLLLLKKPFDNMEVRQLASALTEKWNLARRVERQFDDLERLVAERTAELSDANRLLQAEIDERNRTETILREKEEQLREVKQMEAISTLAGGVAHEFNNLLQAIHGYTRFAMQELDASSQPYRDLQQSIDATDRAAVLTRQLLGFSRQSTLRIELLDSNDIVRELAATLNLVLGERIELMLELDDDLNTIRADRTMLLQALMSLCINARQAMPDGGRLLIKTEEIVIKDAPFPPNTIASPGRYVMFVIADTGIGMPPEVLERIFEPFFTTKEVGQGTGLGLAIVHGIVQQHGGVVDVVSAPGHGTTFKILLPATNEGAAMAVNCEPAVAT